MQEKREDRHGSYYKLGMIERLSLTLDNYASSEIGSRYYSEEFFKGVCERRNELHALLSKRTGILIFFTVVLAFMDYIEGSAFYFGLQFNVPEVGAYALCVGVSILYMSWAFCIIDVLTIDRLISRLGNRLGLFAFELLLLPYSTINLWTLALQPKYFGLASQHGHKLVFSVSGFFISLLGVIIALFPVSVVGYFIIQRPLLELQIIEVLLAFISAFIILCTIFLLISFSFRYKFRPTGTAEPEAPIAPENLRDIGNPIVHRKE